MRLFIDVDALAKLAHWRLLEELQSLVEIPLSQCATLTSAKFRAERSVGIPDGKLFRSTEAATLALTAIRGMMASVSPEERYLPAMQNVPGIDAGEAVLLSALLGSEDVRLLTGDKRALRALATLGRDKLIGFTGKILLIEQIVLAALNRHDIFWLRDRICAHKDIDKAIGNAMGSKCDASCDSVREGLESYIAEIARASVPSLIAEIGPSGR